GGRSVTAFGARGWLALLFVRGVTGRRGAAIGEEQGRSLPVAIRIPAWLRSALHTARDRSVSMPARLPNRGQKPGARRRAAVCGDGDGRTPDRVHLPALRDCRRGDAEGR